MDIVRYFVSPNYADNKPNEALHGASLDSIQEVPFEKKAGRVEVTEFTLLVRMGTATALALLDANGLRSAVYAELKAVAKKYSYPERPYKLIALGSIYGSPEQGTLAPCIGGNVQSGDQERVVPGVSFVPAEQIWPEGTRFAVVSAW